MEDKDIMAMLAALAAPGAYLVIAALRTFGPDEDR